MALDVKIITDNRQFWKTMKLFFFDRNITTTQITIENSKKVIVMDFELSEGFGNFFEKAVQSSNGA